jgi:hypothetical protein
MMTYGKRRIGGRRGDGAVTRRQAVNASSGKYAGAGHDGRDAAGAC